MPDKNVALVDNVLDVQCETPVELIPNHVLRRPTDEELQRFRDALHQWGGPIDATIPFEFVMAGDETKSAGRRSSNAADWKYWVVAVGEANEGPLNAGLLDLEVAARLTEVELKFRLQIMGPQGMSLSGSNNLIASNGLRLPKIPLPFTADSVRLLGELHRKIKGVSESHPTIYRAIRRYEQLASFDPMHVLYLLGVFAAIEAILTHDPHGTYDSLGHQIKKKMKLLNTRFARQLVCDDFGDVAFEKLWSKLYELRSLVAHGEDPVFTGSMQVLKDFRTTTKFLDQAAKALLRHALEEPQLVLDLQEC